MDYEALRFIWWLLIGVLLIGFSVTDGFDMGVAALLKVVGKNNDERRVMINTIAPHWDGNQVWLVTAGGALLADSLRRFVQWLLSGHDADAICTLPAPAGAGVSLQDRQ